MVKRLGAEFRRRGMHGHLAPLRLYWLALRHDLVQAERHGLHVQLSEEMVVEWFKLLRLPPVRARLSRPAARVALPAMSARRWSGGRGGDRADLPRGPEGRLSRLSRRLARARAAHADGTRFGCLTEEAVLASALHGAGVARGGGGLRAQRAGLRVLPGAGRPPGLGVRAEPAGGRRGLHRGAVPRLPLRRGQLGPHHDSRHAHPRRAAARAVRAGVSGDGPLGVLPDARRAAPRLLPGPRPDLRLHRPGERRGCRGVPPLRPRLDAARRGDVQGVPGAAHADGGRPPVRGRARSAPPGRRRTSGDPPELRRRHRAALPLGPGARRVAVAGRAVRTWPGRAGLRAFRGVARAGAPDRRPASPRWLRHADPCARTAARVRRWLGPKRGGGGAHRRAGRQGPGGDARRW